MPNKVLKLLITYDNYIKFNLFFTRLIQHIFGAETIFDNPKLKNLEFITIKHSKLDASSSDINSSIVLNHYTVGAGPTIFKFNFISPKLSGRNLINPMDPISYSEFYN